MKLIAVSFTAFMLASGLANAQEGERYAYAYGEKGCPDYRLEGDRVVEICDPDKLAEGDFLSPSEFAQGFGGFLTSTGGSDDSSGSSSQ